MTALAAGVVWWGLGPLLVPIMRNAAAPAQPSSPAASATPAVSMPPTASSAPARPRVTARPSMYEGWQLIDGAFVQSFELEGGKATVRIAGGRVRLVSSQPSNGYTITPRQPSADRLVLEFFNGTHYFVLDAMWWENRPYVKITQVS